LQERWNVTEEEQVVFIQTSMDVNRHRDGIRFTRTGYELLLQHLPEGLHVKIVSLGGDPVLPNAEAVPLRETLGARS
jgi:hypothetical protein